MTPTTLRERVLDTIPGYHDAQTIIAHGERVSTPTPPNTKEARASIFGRVHAAILAGDQIPDSVAEELAAIEQAQRDHDTLLGMAREVVAAAKQTVDVALPIYDDAAYGLLDAELQTLVADVKKLLPKLQGATTADEALALGDDSVHAWRDLQKHTNAYDEIRTVQIEILPRELNFWDRTLTVGLYRDALAVHPFFAQRQAQSSPGVGWNATHAHTPLSGESTWWPDDVDRPAGLLRIVSSTTPWVPTPSVMEGVYTRATAATARIELDTERAADERERRLAEHDNYLARL